MTSLLPFTGILKQPRPFGASFPGSHSPLANLVLALAGPANSGSSTYLGEKSMRLPALHFRSPRRVSSQSTDQSAAHRWERSAECRRPGRPWGQRGPWEGSEAARAASGSWCPAGGRQLPTLLTAI